MKEARMNDKPLSCNVKPAIIPTVDGRIGSQTGCKIIDITFPNIVNPEVSSKNVAELYIFISYPLNCREITL